MKIEHFAINVKNPQEMTEWYTKHLGLRAVKKMDQVPYMTFLADDSGKIMLEIYHNPKAQVLDFPELDPLMVHLAFVSENPTVDKERLIAAGAGLISDEKLEDGSHLVMLKDPWGLAIQLCKRNIPMLRS